MRVSNRRIHAAAIAMSKKGKFRESAKRPKMADHGSFLIQRPPERPLFELWSPKGTSRLTGPLKSRRLTARLIGQRRWFEQPSDDLFGKFSFYGDCIEGLGDAGQVVGLDEKPTR